MRPSKRLISTLFLSLLAIGCSSSKPEEPKELKDPAQKDATTVSLDTPEQTMLESAKSYFDSGLYSLAKEHFTALRTAYPNSQWSEFAQIKIADCLFESEEFPEAAKAYEEYIQNKPTSEATAYMLFRAARSYQLTFKGVGRDPAPLSKSLELFNQLIATYPDSPYIESGKKFRSEAVDKLVEHENKIKQFYEKQEKPAAAQARERMINEQWVPVLKETRYAASDRTQQAPEGELPPAAVVDASQEPTHAQPHSGAVETISTSGRILKIECSTGSTHGVFIYFDRDIPLLGAYKKSQRLVSINNSLTLTLPGVVAPEQTSDCFGQKDLSLSTIGTMSLKSSKDATVMSLSNPPRLFIAVK